MSSMQKSKTLGNNVAILKCQSHVTERKSPFLLYQTKIQRATDLFDWIIN